MKIRYYDENTKSLAKITFQTFESNDYKEIIRILESRFKEYGNTIIEVSIKSGK
jgi:glutathionyl-hydroquinone reductase